MKKFNMKNFLDMDVSELKQVNGGSDCLAKDPPVSQPYIIRPLLSSYCSGFDTGYRRGPSLIINPFSVSKKIIRAY